MSEIIDALNQLEREKSVSKELVMEAIEKSLVAACEKDYGKNVLVEAHMDRETGAITVVRKKEVVEEVENDENQISLTEAKAMDDKYEIGDFVEYPLESMDFGRMAAQKARSIIIQNIKEGERDAIYERFACKEHDIVNGVVQRFVDNTIYISLDDKTETRLKENEQVKSEHYKVGDHIKLYVVEVKKPEKKEKIVPHRAKETHRGNTRFISLGEGTLVISPLYGEGIIMEISNGRMTVKFTEVEKEYTYPAAFAAGEIEVLEKEDK